MKTSKFLPLIVLIALAACSDKPAANETASATVVVASTPAPAPEPAPAAPAPAAAAPVQASAADLAKGEKVYGATCLACHGAGVMGAPKFADKAAWQPRIAKGTAVLYASAVDGLKMMPAKGGNMMLKDDEVKAAVDYMVSKSI
jgi:cytochrome c5